MEMMTINVASLKTSTTQEYHWENAKQHDNIIWEFQRFHGQPWPTQYLNRLKFFHAHQTHIQPKNDCHTKDMLILSP